MLRQCSQSTAQRLRRTLVSSASRSATGFHARQFSRLATPLSSRASTSPFTRKALDVSQSFARARRMGRTMSTMPEQAQKASGSGSAGAGATGGAPWLKLLAALGVAGGVGGGLYYQTVMKPLLEAPDATLMPVLEPPEEFRHPYDDRPWYWRAMFRAKRFVQLCLLWVPCAAGYAIYAITDNEDWRKYWISLLVDTLERAGCTFQKFGQWLSMRPDVFPPDLIEALASLRDQAPSHEYEHTRKMIRESFGKEIEELFEEFDEKPVASGTVAQVHRAVLRDDMAELANIRTPDGELVKQVAIKVRHPRVLEECWMDLDLLFTFINNTNCMVVPFKKDDFSEVMQKQLDFTWEAHNLQKFARNFHTEIKEGKVQFPAVSTELLSPGILVESWAKGNTVSDIFSEVGENFKEFADDVTSVARKFGDSIKQTKKELAWTVFDMNMKMFLRDNLVHGDLHGGNVLYSEDSRTCTVLDAGLTTSIGNDVKSQFGEFLHALCTGNSNRMVDKLMEFQCKDKLPEPDDAKAVQELEARRVAFRADLEECLSNFIARDGRCTAPDGSPISLGDVMGQLVFALQRHQIELRGDVAASIMTMSVSEGLIRSLDPEFDCVRASLPYFVRFNGWSSVDAVIDHSKQV